MIDTILLDLDGTLLRVSQKTFVYAYLNELKKVFVRLDMDAELLTKALLVGTKAMICNDGSMLNEQRFWSNFADYMGLSAEQCVAIETACYSFYCNEFNAVKTVVEPSEIPARIVGALKTKGYSVVLATNPLFPACAVTTRLNWIGLEPSDFALVTHYANSTYCKPNHGYYKELLTRINKEPSQCLMAGNNLSDDMCSRALGIETFLVTDYIENEKGEDISIYRHGSLAELEEFLLSLPDIML